VAFGIYVAVACVWVVEQCNVCFWWGHRTRSATFITGTDDDDQQACIRAMVNGACIGAMVNGTRIGGKRTVLTHGGRGGGHARVTSARVHS
jgi:hypothetical protein